MGLSSSNTNTVWHVGIGIGMHCIISCDLRVSSRRECVPSRRAQCGPRSVCSGRGPSGGAPGGPGVARWPAGVRASRERARARDALRARPTHGTPSRSRPSAATCSRLCAQKPHVTSRSLIHFHISLSLFRTLGYFNLSKHVPIFIHTVIFIPMLYL